jgi:predicted dehydrogenase
MKALFIGLGSIGQRHLRNLKKLQPEIEVIAIRSIRSAPVLSYENQVVEGQIISDHYDLIEFDELNKGLAENPDLIFITNPTSLHMEVALKAVKTGAFVFIEKPISNSYDGVEELIRIEESFGKNKVLVGYQYRYHPALKLIKNLLDDEIIGRVVSAQLRNGEYMPEWHPYEDYRLSYAARSNLGGGAIVTQIHDFDYAMWLFGYPESLFSLGGKLSNLEIDVEDTAQVLMSFSGIPVSIQLDYLHWPSRRELSITGDKGSIECNLNNMEVILNNRITNSKDKYEFEDFQRNDLFLAEMKNFLAFASGKEKPVVSLKKAASSLRVALSAIDSIKYKKAQKLLWS